MSDETLLDELLSRWQGRAARGEVVSAADVCGDCPELLPEFQRRLDALRAMRQILATTVPGVAAPASVPPPAVSGYEVLGELGRGGMGVVYKARQTALKRLTALKMILAGPFAGPDELARFRGEAQALARLQHPNIVQIYEVGEAEGRPFLALEYVEGGSLARQLDGAPWPQRQAAQLTEVLARAVHAAHQKGVVHRDLKPANVLLTADGVPKVTDFGLAKRLDACDDRTQSGAVFGTPAYMAPEQAGGKAKDAGPATDVYALGAILYELLTGRPPFQGETVLSVLNKVESEEPTPPSRLRSGLSRDLQAVCLTCLEKEPGRRYAGAAALADDLRAFLQGEAIRARPAGVVERLARRVRRRPGRAGLLAAAAGVGLSLLLGGWWFAFAVSGLAVTALLAGGWWYSVRLRTALADLVRQQRLAERHVERLSLLLDTTRRLMSATGLESLRLISETAKRLTDAEFSTVYVVDHRAGMLWSKVAGEEAGEIRLPLGVGLAGAVAVTGELVNLPDAYADPRFNPEVDRRTGCRTRSLITLPMNGRDGRVVGVFQVMNKRGGAFGPEDVMPLRSLAATAAVALEQMQEGERPGTPAAPAETRPAGAAPPVG